MTESFQWSDKDSKAANIKNASVSDYKQGRNKLKKKKSLGKEVGDTIKNHIEILESKNTITKVKNSVDGLINRRERMEERISELENRTLEITQSGGPLGDSVS